MQNKPQKTPNSKTSNSTSIRMYFYTNSIFMGLSKTLQRVGTSLILFHDNTCAVVSYNNNSQFDGKSIFYRNRSLISVNFVRNRIQDVVYRIDGYLLYLRYNQQAKMHGDGYLVSFLERTIHLLKYQQGYIKQKIKLLAIEKTPIQTVFLNESFHLLVGKSHNSVIRHEVTPQDIQNIRVRKIGNKVQVNYMENSQQRLSQGLGFEFIYRAPQNGGYDPQTNRFKDQFQLKIVERGFYHNNMLDGYGMRIFKNNNVYEGYFTHNVFHGEGCLRNLQKGTWVYGVFENGEMKNILDFSNQGNQMAKCNALLAGIRQTETNFINSMIEQNNFDFLDAELEKICGIANLEQLGNESLEDKKLQLMRKITAQFTQLETINKSSLEQDINKVKNNQLLYSSTTANKKIKQLNNKNGGSQTQRKQKQHPIKSLIPHSIRAPNYFNSTWNNQKDLAHIEEDKQKFDKILKLSHSIKDPMKKYSRIFHKTYSYLEKQQSENSPNNQNQHSAKKRMRKSQIFTPQSNFKQKLSLSPLRLTAEHSPGQVYRGRSPDRKTTIFSNTVKLKKYASPKNNQNNDQQFNLAKIKRGSSIEKKTKAKLKKTNNSPIFEQQKQKVIDNTGKFIYTYEQNENNEGSPTHDIATSDKRYTKLQPPSLLAKSSFGIKK